MLRSQSISNINEKKSTKFYNPFKKTSFSNLNNSSNSNNSSTTEKRKSRPLSTSISAINLKISSPILNSSNNNVSSPTIEFGDEDKENIRLKTRSSTPNLKNNSNDSNNTNNIPRTSTKNISSTTNRLKRLSYLGSPIKEDRVSPVTINSQIDSIFDQSSITYIDSDIEEDISSTISSIEKPDPNYTYSKQQQQQQQPLTNSQSLQNISNQTKKLHRTTNLYNLNEFVKKIQIENNNRKSIEIENNEILKLNSNLNLRNDKYLSKISILENFIMLSTKLNNYDHQSQENEQLDLNNDIDWNHVFKIEEYNNESDFFEIDGDQLYLMF
ncbi:uncharacterized protein KGF55_004219 [Candida pseudojiufengensis]|uniref:uncharacterized protein n=1 Tax=Candida pseudojiufengensis TaxID=497109 RepID=UPI002224C31D|nr:uncharacterized protein KGF55_004219 [Candida pseudojiufengensis]KAI5960952.1 hypothetical protein KGF55_004219 [Candida pseudojiufengensis]